MTTFEYVADQTVQRNFEASETRLLRLEQSVVRGTGAPTHSPVAPQLYLREDGAAGSSIYAWDTASWTAIA